jgi:hypothetical protein
MLKEDIAALGAKQHNTSEVRARLVLLESGEIGMGDERDLAS